ncbi:PTS mannitol transporter subunit IICB [Microbacterium immunditiarum]|uniref:PTS system mannitol-specific EIICB component n=1 Tax=Microbacterium immunditiarum TaxID=337480 RepID=A0A7Y9KKQ2_9MICO|nr:PTS mannitol transporter subunit IICB [Microbacterium immunditiarum]NYE21070.1 PTS system mannitol-specific IIC component [Microbacterium immunditiarum]
MTTASTSTTGGSKARIGVQRFGTYLSGMIMPNIPALIAWGIITAFFIEVGWTPNADLATIVFPTIHYLLPILIAYTGGNIVYGIRGGVVASIGVMGAIVGSDLLVDKFNATLPEGDSGLGYVHMFIGAMIMAPLAAYTMKWLDNLWEGKIRAGFEMLVNMFSAGIWGFVLIVIGFYPIAWLVNGIMTVLGNAVNWLVETNLLPLTSIIIEPAKVFFLNNAINHGVLTPLGLQQVADDGSSILFLLEANPGPGVGLLLAFTFFGLGAARASAPGAAVIQFFGGIHEVYFPYALMKPMLILALIAGGMTGVTTNMLLSGSLAAPAAPGSIIAVTAQAVNPAAGGVPNLMVVYLSVLLSATVTFLVSWAILRASRKRDLEAMAATDDAFGAAITQTEAAKGKSSDALAGLRGGAATQADGGIEPATMTEREVRNIVFACDAGMGSSAMGASVLRNKIKKAGIEDVTVVNKAIAALDTSADLVITQNQLTDRARHVAPDAIHVSVDNFMNSPRYDEVVDLVRAQHEDGSQGGAP